ncbi:TrmH family RNA methyltransferase [Pseudodesulfovibrio tunisiensis]|uniref:TrmH family RNA methyltransferase n=1 Tax=Pseudodesulfovibrio tunisiensis TaxID=463192 RepID=UPI001FB2FB64|nr:RNA methyltransferase [Pseudodesulfovibrio tunisiensis]
MQGNDRQAGDGKLYIVGNKPVLELLEGDSGRVDFVYFRKGRHDRHLEEIIALCRERKVPFKAVPVKDLDRMYRGNHQGVAARCAALEYTPLEKLIDMVHSAPVPLIVALDQVQDPGNVGALARTVFALGGAGIIVCRHHGAYLGTGAVRSSAGAINQLPVAKAGNMAQAVQQCADSGLTIYCAQKSDISGNAFETEFKAPAVLVLGNEEKGIRPGVAKYGDYDIEIPFARDFDSLNVAQAGAILVSEFARQTGK